MINLSAVVREEVSIHVIKSKSLMGNKNDPTLSYKTVEELICISGSENVRYGRRYK